MHTIRGRLSRAEYVDRAGMALLSLTIEQPGAGRYTAQPIEALMTYGSGDVAHAAAQRAANSLILGGIYRVIGRGLAATGGQVWLTGVEEWQLMEPSPLSLEASAPIPLDVSRGRFIAQPSAVSA